MAIYFKCPYCKRGSVDEMGENTISYEKGFFKCENCGRILSLVDAIDYEEYAKLENLV